MENKQAFTLIELLVVVLIIGILAAVALPQYEKAIIKSRLSGLKPIVESLTNAMETYYLATNTYPSSFDELDIGIPTPTSTEQIGAKFIAYYPWGNCHMNVSSEQQFIACQNTLSHIGYSRSLHTTTQYAVSRACYASSDNAIKVCKQETKTNTPYFTGLDGISNTQVQAFAYQDE